MVNETVRFEVVNGESDITRYLRCVICGTPLTSSQKKCCSRECNGERYEILTEMRNLFQSDDLHITWNK